MARKSDPANLPVEGQAIPESEHPIPEAGGSYSRDPVTGDLTLIHRTSLDPVEDDAIPFDDAATQQVQE
jgi:hypothetical protein